MKIREIILFTNLLNEQRSFYSDILELEIISSDNESFSVKAGASVITFKAASGDDNPQYHFAFNIPENQLAATKEWALKRFELITLDGEDEFNFESWNAHSVYFYDPAGNIVEFIARHNLRNRSDEAFSGKSILSVSEIGLPVKNVKEFFDKISSELKIPLFSGDEKNFAAMGDDEGLFIIVPEDRRWFPDCYDSKIFPVKVKIECGIITTIQFEDLPYLIESH